MDNSISQNIKRIKRLRIDKKHIISIKNWISKLSDNELEHINIIPNDDKNNHLYGFILTIDTNPKKIISYSTYTPERDMEFWIMDLGTRSKKLDKLIKEVIENEQKLRKNKPKSSASPKIQNKQTNV